MRGGYTTRQPTVEVSARCSEYGSQTRMKKIYVKIKKKTGHLRDGTQDTLMPDLKTILVNQNVFIQRKYISIGLTMFHFQTPGKSVFVITKQ